MISLSSLPSTTKTAKRRGRGPASGLGKTAGRGTKGQKSRTGHAKLPARFEGGQLPIHMRLPQLRGFRNPLTAERVSVTVSQVAKIKATTVDIAVLKEADVIPRYARRVKLVAGGDARKQTITVDHVTPAAKKAVEAAGGSVKTPKGE